MMNKQPNVSVGNAEEKAGPDLVIQDDRFTNGTCITYRE